MSSEFGQDNRQWFYASGDRQIGPNTKAQMETLVRSGVIQATTLVWAEGMDQWRTAREVPEVSALFLSTSPAPPPLPIQTAQPQPQYQSPYAPQYPPQVVFQKQKSSSAAVIVVVLGVLVLGGLAIVGILAAIAVPNFMEAQVRAKVSRTKSDMRSLDTGIQAYFVDNNAYPPEVVGANGFPSVGGAITTPIAYLTSVFPDPFAEKGTDGTLRFLSFTNVKTGKGAAVIWSLGPDQINNIRWKDLGRTFDADELMEYVYDPTNGTVSGGDILRISEQ